MLLRIEIGPPCCACDARNESARNDVRPTQKHETRTRIERQRRGAAQTRFNDRVLRYRPARRLREILRVDDAFDRLDPNAAFGRPELDSKTLVHLRTGFIEPKQRDTERDGSIRAFVFVADDVAAFDIQRPIDAESNRLACTRARFWSLRPGFEALDSCGNARGRNEHRIA